MELKNFFVLDDQGNTLSGATCYLYERGSETLVTGLQGANGLPRNNPFASDQQGLVQFAAPDGLYDLRVIKGNRDNRIRLQFNDVTETTAVAERAAKELEEKLKDPTDPSKGAGMLGFVQHGFGAKERTILEKVREFLSVKDFGAKGDGVSDDTSAVQAALNVGGNIYFPPGIYFVKKMITVSVANTHLKGSGEGYIGTQIRTMPGFSGSDIFKINNYGAIFEGLMLWGDGTLRGVGATVSGINFDRADLSADIDCFVKNCAFSYLSTCIRAIGKNISIRDSLFGQSKRGITFNQRVGTACYGVRIERNRFHGIGGADYKGSADNDPDVSGPNPGYCIDARDTGDITFTQIVDNYADTSGRFFIGRLPFGTLSNNVIKDAWSTAIQVENSTHVNISNNQIRSGFKSKDTGHGIYLTSNVSMSNVEGNIISGFCRHGLFHESGYQVLISGNQITDNNFAGVYGGDGINIASGVISDVVTGNVVRTTAGGVSGHRYGIYTGGASCFFDGNLVQASMVSNFFDESASSLGMTQSVTETRRTVYGNGLPTIGLWSRGDRLLLAAPAPSGVLGYICTTSGAAGSTAVFKSFGTISS